MVNMTMDVAVDRVVVENKNISKQPLGKLPATSEPKKVVTTNNTTSNSTASNNTVSNDINLNNDIKTDVTQETATNVNEIASGEVLVISGDKIVSGEELENNQNVDGTNVSIDAGIDTGMDMDMGMMMPDMGNLGMDGAEKGGISDTVVLTIVIVICVILGIGLGILAGRRNANK